MTKLKNLFAPQDGLFMPIASSSSPFKHSWLINLSSWIFLPWSSWPLSWSRQWNWYLKLISNTSSSRKWYLPQFSLFNKYHYLHLHCTHYNLHTTLLFCSHKIISQICSNHNTSCTMHS
jgi:hypothetical protein